MIAVAGTVLLVWRGPWWIDGEYLDRKELRSGSAALVTGFRAAVVQLLAILGASVALLFTAFNYRLTRRGQVTDRFTKALERLGSDELYVRIGGLLALEQIVQDAPEQAAHASQVLSSFIRRRAPQRPDQAVTSRERIAAARRAARKGETRTASPAPLPERPEDDVRQALTALVRAGSRRQTLPPLHIDFRRLHLRQADLDGADLSHVDLAGADLAHARLNGANRIKAELCRVNLTYAGLSGADLTRVSLEEADLAHANLTDATLTGASLHAAILTDASVNEADLTKAHLDGAKLVKARFHGANLNHARLWGADLTGADLRGANLTSAHLGHAILANAYLDGADLTDVHLRDADLTDVVGLTVEQVLSAHPAPSTKLPSEIASAPSVIARIEAVEEARHRRERRKSVGLVPQPSAAPQQEASAASASGESV